MTMRRDSGKASATPHSGASGPDPRAEPRRVRRDGDAARAACGRGSPGKLSLRAAPASSERASERPRGKYTAVKRPTSQPARARRPAPAAGGVAGDEQRPRRRARPRRAPRRTPRSARARYGSPPCSTVVQHLGALLSPRIELVRREAVAPRLHRLVLLAVEPVRAPELVVRLDQVRARARASSGRRSARPRTCRARGTPARDRSARTASPCGRCRGGSRATDARSPRRRCASSGRCSRR